MSAKSISKTFDDVPYKANDEKEAAAFWADATPHLGLEDFRRSRGQRGAQKAPTKEQVSVRFDLDILAVFRASGPGWQTRMNAALADWLKSHSLKELPS